MIVIHASTLVAALTRSDETWALDQIAGGVLGRARSCAGRGRKRLDRTQATLAHRDLLALPIDLHPHEVVAERAWELRTTTTIDDGTYLALAEALDAPLVTLDDRLRRVPGTSATVRTPRG